MKKFLLTAIALCLGVNLMAQTYERGGFSNVGSGSQSIINYTNFEGGIKGHRYFTDAWTDGILIINDSITSPKPKMQYDMISGHIILGGSSDDLGFAIQDKSLTSFKINKDNVYFNFVRKEGNDFLEAIDRQYFNSPFKGKDYLLIDYRKVLREPKSSKNSYTTISQDKVYKDYKIYYLLNKDGKYVKLDKLKKSKVLKALNDKKLKKYTKDKDLNLKKERDVNELLAYYHSY